MTQHEIVEPLTAVPLKLCPFCGAVPEIDEDVYFDISCSNTDCCIGLNRYKTKELAFQAWNERPLDKAINKPTTQAELKQSHDILLRALISLENCIDKGDNENIAYARAKAGKIIEIANKL